MLLTITTTHRPAGDLGYLLHKYPDRVQGYDLSFGRAHVFYPEVSEERRTACLLLEVDPVGIVRGRGSGERPDRRGGQKRRRRWRCSIASQRVPNRERHAR
jgi:hypothetical protein